MTVLPFSAQPTCAKCKRGDHERAKYVRETHVYNTHSDVLEFLEWTCWFCGYVWRSTVADDNAPR